MAALQQFAAGAVCGATADALLILSTKIDEQWLISCTELQIVYNNGCLTRLEYLRIRLH
jgi:hypothetical protein